jgi:hypothetical protein
MEWSHANVLLCRVCNTGQGGDNQFAILARYHKMFEELHTAGYRVYMWYVKL